MITQKIKYLVLAAAIGTSPAIAQSAFEGAYGQIGIGYESASPSFSGGVVPTAAGPRPYSVSASNANSFAGTVTLGYNFAVTNTFLLGIGAEYSPIAGQKANYTLTVPGVGSATDQYNKQNSYNIFLSPGFAIDKDKLAYAKVGYTGTSIKAASDGSTTNYTGYSLGLGYKQIINGGLYGFLEGNYASYGNQNVSGGLTGTSNVNATNILVGLGYKF